AALAELGGFDERLRFGEDVDVVWRLTDAGHLVRYHPAAVVTHRPRATLGSWLRQRYDYGTSAAPLARRHPGRLACARVSAWHALSWGALVVALGP
ncbi:glycosyltransferase family 2 protein, partial [Nocardia cyriacigeorgica]|nr:mycofactocin system glycosyltransferase [Nocardia cyriacigeorgica]